MDITSIEQKLIKIAENQLRIYEVGFADGKQPYEERFENVSEIPAEEAEF